MKLKIIQILGLILLLYTTCQAQGRANWKIGELRDEMNKDYITTTEYYPDSTMSLDVDCGNYYVKYIFDKDSIAQFCYTFFKDQKGVCEYIDLLDEAKVYDSVNCVWLSKDKKVLYTTIPIYNKDGDIMYFVTKW